MEFNDADDDIIPAYDYAATFTPEQAARLRQQLESVRIHKQIMEEVEYDHLFDSGERYRGKCAAKTNWIVEGLLPEGFLAILGATSKAGKTCFATALAMAVSTGQPFLGKNVQQGGVLWCAFEESEAERLHVLNQWPEIPKSFYIGHELPPIDSEEGLASLRIWVRMANAKLIVVDPLYGATAAESLADGRVARRALAGLKEICRQQNCAAIVLHHITKDLSVGLVRERFADSNQILATASMDMLMDSADLPEGGRLLTIACRGRGDFANRTLYVKSSGVTNYELVDKPGPLPTKADRIDERIFTALANSPAGFTAAEMASNLELNLYSVRNRVTRLAQEGRIRSSGKRQNAKIYTLTP